MKHKTHPVKPALSISACSFAIEPGKDVQLLPAGEFRSIDGRPKDVAAWRIDDAIAQRVIAVLSRRTNDLVIDYEHQTLYKEKNGQPAPAAGWFSGSRLEWREGAGLFACDVDWTARAAGHIESREYKYISPVFAYNKKGEIVTILHVALTNDPALDGLGELAVAAATLLLTDENEKESLSMDLEELLSNVRWMLNLPTLATQEEIAAELQKAVDKIKAGNPETAAAGFNLAELVQARNTQIAALTSAVPDPAKYVPISTMQTMQEQIATLTAQINGKTVDDLVEVALSAGKLLPAQESWARDLGKSNLAALTSYLDTAQPVAALSGIQSGGKSPDAETGTGGLSDEQLAVCTQMGISKEDFLETLKA
jgi:phage I-like protein